MEMSTRQQWLANRLNVCTAMTFEELTELPLVVQCNMFFTWDGIDDESLLSSFRRISDAYSSGEISRDEARNLLLRSARGNGRDDGTNGLRNLASTARLNLILDQNAKMARAISQFEGMHRPANLKMFPYVIYRASVGSNHPNPRHQQYDGMIIDKRDPWLHTHWPPSELGCNCDLENCSAKKAATLGNIKPMSDPGDVKVESDSGFVFDPASALVKTPDGYRAYTTDELRRFL